MPLFIRNTTRTMRVITTVVIRPLDDITTYFVFDFRSTIWGFGKKWTIVHGTIPQPTNVLLYVLRRSPTARLTFQMGLFDHPQFGGHEGLAMVHAKAQT